MRSLGEIRSDIDAADAALVAALKRRLALSAEAQDAKRALGLPAKDEAREREVAQRAVAAVDPADRDAVFGVYEKIFGAARGVIETIARGVAIRNGRVLLCRAKGSAISYLPGGHVEFGETAREALVREIREETGLASTAGRFLGVVENKFLQHGRPHAEVNLIYALELASDEVTSAEDWIAFEWCDIRCVAEAGLMPESIRPYVV